MPLPLIVTVGALVDECEWTRAGIEYDTVHLGIGCEEHALYAGKCERCGVGCPIWNSSGGVQFAAVFHVPEPGFAFQVAPPCESRGCQEEQEHADSAGCAPLNSLGTAGGREARPGDMVVITRALLGISGSWPVGPMRFLMDATYARLEARHK